MFTHQDYETTTMIVIYPEYHLIIPEKLYKILQVYASLLWQQINYTNMFFYYIFGNDINNLKFKFRIQIKFDNKYSPNMINVNTT